MRRRRGLPPDPPAPVRRSLRIAGRAPLNPALRQSRRVAGLPPPVRPVRSPDRIMRGRFNIGRRRPPSDDEEEDEEEEDYDDQDQGGQGGQNQGYEDEEEDFGPILIEVPVTPASVFSDVWHCHSGRPPEIRLGIAYRLTSFPDSARAPAPLDDAIAIELRLDPLRRGTWTLHSTLMLKLDEDERAADVGRAFGVNNVAGLRFAPDANPAHPRRHELTRDPAYWPQQRWAQEIGEPLPAGGAGYDTWGFVNCMAFAIASHLYVFLSRDDTHGARRECQLLRILRRLRDLRSGYPARYWYEPVSLDGGADADTPVEALPRPALFQPLLGGGQAYDRVEELVYFVIVCPSQDANPDAGISLPRFVWRAGQSRFRDVFWHFRDAIYATFDRPADYRVTFDEDDRWSTVNPESHFFYAQVIVPTRGFVPLHYDGVELRGEADFDAMSLRFGARRSLATQYRYIEGNPETLAQLARREKAIWDPGDVPMENACIAMCTLYHLLFALREPSILGHAHIRTAKDIMRRLNPRPGATVAPATARRYANNRLRAAQAAGALCGIVGWERRLPVPLALLRLAEDRFRFRYVVFQLSNLRPIYVGRPPHLDSAENRRAALERTCYLIVHDGHALYVKDPCKLFNTSGTRRLWCHACVSVHRDPNHRCEGSCPHCPHERHGHLGPVEATRTCGACGASLPEPCFELHLQLGDCQRFWTCTVCQKRYARATSPPEAHDCGRTMCPNCHERVPSMLTHQCFLAAKQLSGRARGKLVAFDFETSQEDGEGKHDLLHVVNHWQAAYVYEPPAPGLPALAEGDSVDSFLDWAIRTEHRDFRFVAHNGRGYDFYLVADALTRRGELFEALFQGAAIMQLKVKKCKVSFVCSLNFLPMALSKFPAAFGIEELKKGYFPHRFNTAANQDYVGPIPGREAYFTERMSDAERLAFFAWHDARVAEGYVFDFRREMREYCHSDVMLLRAGIRAFHAALWDTLGDEGVHPFADCLTMASTCLTVFRNYFLPRGAVAILNAQQDRFARLAFFGGRTNGFKLRYRCRPGEQIRHFDIRSLYPAVLAQAPLPAGAARFVEPAELAEMGETARLQLALLEPCIAEVTFEAPEGLYVPVLPIRLHGKLVFPLTNEDGRRGRCRGAYCSVELRFAVERCGYRVLEVHRVLRYERWATDIFAEYVHAFFRTKTEAEGWPAGCDSPEARADFLAEFEHANRIPLRPDRVRRNPAARALAKLMLNCLWGKLGQRRCQKKTAFFSDPVELYRRLRDPRVVVTDLQHVNSLTSCTWEPAEQETAAPLLDNEAHTTNTGLAAFVCAHGRLRLAEMMLRIERARAHPGLIGAWRLLYVDTDSAIFVCEEGSREAEALLGPLLGDWSDERPRGARITDFVCLGPKTYAYRWTDPAGAQHETVKAKGIMQRPGNRHLVCFDEFLRLVLERDRGAHSLVTNSTILRSRAGAFSLNTAFYHRMIRCTYEKRRVLDPDGDFMIDTLPLVVDDATRMETEPAAGEDGPADDDE